MLKRTIYSLAIVALIAGCSSGTKLNDAPVVDANAGQGSGGAASGVAPVSIDPNAQTAQGPVGVARIIYFDFDSYTVKPEFQQLIDGHARFLKANPNRRISIEGHTDEVPINTASFHSNWELSSQRAINVLQALQGAGVARERMSARAYADTRPLAGSAQQQLEQRRASNRRVVIRVE